MAKIIVSILILILTSVITYIHYEKNMEVEYTNSINNVYEDINNRKTLNYLFFQAQAFKPLQSNINHCKKLCFESEYEESKLTILCEDQMGIQHVFEESNIFNYEASVYYCSDRKDIVLKDFTLEQDQKYFFEMIKRGLKIIDKKVNLHIKTQKYRE
jgi:hypothetical protein